MNSLLPTQTIPGDRLRPEPKSELLRSGAQTQFIPSLHGLRGAMAWWVVLGHTATSIKFFQFGYVAVDVFFVLSGYVLMHTHAAGMRVLSGSAVNNFLWRRCKRTIPLFLACYILEMVIYIHLHRTFPSVKEAGESLFMLEYWAAEGMGLNYPMWSLGVEWIGYLIFPLVAYYVVGIRSLYVCVVLLVMLSVTRSVGMLSMEVASVPFATGGDAVLRMACGFVSGCVLWRLTQIKDSKPPNDLTLILVVIGAVILLMYGPRTVILPFLILLVYSLASPGRIGAFLFSNKLALFFGKISFALYLSHALIVDIVETIQPKGLDAIGRAKYTVALYLIVIAIAFALYRIIEEPMRKFKLDRIGRLFASRVTARRAPLP